ncbi:hypothetical protein EK21DRAFT_108570 [Setomelanomma holmii]|uniref:Zn(2)-C6 fungal-type domain-containing protein n=1 Tax=Setomelanomma holmii TaxID=210430 RepID=A0A9P4LNG0_9PLEO|nr:hypothetical protein EK21DRAFT_108570 [Setomelanomma holmii]
MATNIYVSSPTEEWEGLMDWGEEIFDPMFYSNTNFTGQGNNLAQDYHIAESVNSEQPYIVSAPPSLADGPPSLEYTSIGGASSSFGQVYCTSPSFDTNATSPRLGQGNGQYFGSFDTCDRAISPLTSINDSPILDTRCEYIEDSLPPTRSLETTTETVFNPHITGSSHSFSGRDVRASQVFANVGTWTDQPQINIEPIAEGDEYIAEAAPIAIPYSHSQSFNSTFTSWPRSEEFARHFRSRAITIPQSSHRPASYKAATAQSQWTQRVPPALSVSPVTSRRPRSVALSRSNSRNGSRRSVASPSPTSASSEGFGWVSYHINSQTNRLAPTSTEGLQGRTPRGRKKGLTAEQRSHAALMRIIGACANCQRRKEKCDPGTPCKSCLDHYKGDLVNHPCRDRVLSDQSSAFLSDRLGWHPTARSLESFLGPNNFNILTGVTYKIPLNFGFGPELWLPVHALQIEDLHVHTHEHVIYTWPPVSSTGDMHTHAVLPAVLTTDAMSNLTKILDRHLALLVTNSFRQFPLFTSPLRILRDVYVYFRQLSGSPQSGTLHQALKLLVLVHIGGDITLPSPSADLALSQLVQSTMGITDDHIPTPCFIRSQFGRVMPGLALSLMKEVLSSLEQLLLNRECEDWPVTLAILITILMTVESIQYHAAKLPYHNSYDAPQFSNSEENHHLDDEAVKTLLAFYNACFSGCHARLRPDWEGEATQSQRASSPDDEFVENVRKAISRASGGGYLFQKVNERGKGDDMGYSFDRLVAKLLLLKP